MKVQYVGVHTLGGISLAALSITGVAATAALKRVVERIVRSFILVVLCVEAFVRFEEPEYGRGYWALGQKLQ